MGSPVDHPPEPCLGNCQPSPAAVGVIKHFEGYSPIIYKDAAGYDTIGFGHLIKPGEKIQEPLFQGQFDAVVSWAYNLREGALKSSTMLNKINAGQHEQVPGQMKPWTRAGGKVLKGLERRREAEAALYELRWY